MSNEGEVILGKRVFAVLARCRNMIDDADALCREVEKAAREAGATPVKTGSVSHKFSPHGTTAVVVLEESHVIAETWPEPEHRAVTLNIFTCGNKAVPEKIVELLALVFQAEIVDQKPTEQVTMPI